MSPIPQDKKHPKVVPKMVFSLEMAMAQNDQPPIAGWCYPFLKMIRNLWVIGTIMA